MDMKTYGAASGDGTISSSGMTREQAMRRAQEIADKTGEPAEVYAEPAQEGDEPVAVVQPSGDEITDEQIEQLRTEAAQAGDMAMVAICDVALAQHLDEIADVDDSVRSALEAKGIIPEHVNADVLARAECERVIRAARAQAQA
jgi:hypothetical protein